MRHTKILSTASLTLSSHGDVHKSMGVASNGATSNGATSTDVRGNVTFDVWVGLNWATRGPVRLGLTSEGRAV